MMRILMVWCLFFIVLQNSAQEEGLVKWMTFKEAQEASVKQPKPLLVDFYTTWCGWCKTMMKTTYSDPNIAGYINNWFYPVKFNAETRDTIDYQGVKYVNKGLNGPKSTHDLTLKFLGTQISYPSTVFVANNFQFNLLTQGYLEAKKIEPLLVFVVEGAFRTSSYDDFNKNFQHTFYDTVFPKRQPKWHTFNEALELQKKQPKKIIVNLYTSFCNTCKVMSKTTYADSVLATYLNKNYYLVDFNAEVKSAVNFKGKTYDVTGANGFPFHELSLELTRRNFIIPAMIILNEKLEILDVVNFYQAPQWAGKIAHFFGDGEYKKMKWEDYLKKSNLPANKP